MNITVKSPGKVAHNQLGQAECDCTRDGGGRCHIVYTVIVVLHFFLFLVTRVAVTQKVLAL